MERDGVRARRSLALVSARSASTRPAAGLRTVGESISEYALGVGGGLLFSMPFLYTMEMWWIGFLADPPELLAYTGVTFLLLLGYNRYAGLHEDANWLEVAIDSVEEMGIGVLLAALTLYLLGRLTAEMTALELVGRVLVASMAVAVGVSVGTAQLGGSAAEGDADRGSPSSRAPQAGTAAADPPPAQAPSDALRSQTVGQLVLAFCGAILFAANIAPTEEVLIIGIETTPAKLLGLALLSLLTGAMILVLSGFRQALSPLPRAPWLRLAWVVATNYVAALLASALMLWFFQRFEGGAPAVAAAQEIVLALPAMLGASAGRLLIQ